MTLLEQLLIAILRAFFHEALPLAIQQAEQPSTMTDVSPDPTLNQELQDDLESQIAAGGVAPVGAD